MHAKANKKPKQTVQHTHVFIGKNTAEELLAKILKRHPDPQPDKDNSVETRLTF